MGRKRKRRKTNKFGENEKSWEWSKRPINIGRGWTLLSTECYLKQSCNGCIYYRYCKKTNSDYPILRQVIRELFVKYGAPPQELVDKARGL